MKSEPEDKPSTPEKAKKSSPKKKESPAKVKTTPKTEEKVKKVNPFAGKNLNSFLGVITFTVCLFNFWNTIFLILSFAITMEIAKSQYDDFGNFKKCSSI